MKQYIASINVTALLASLALIGTTGCSTPKDERSEGRELDDKHIVSELHKKLEREPVYKFDGVDVKAFAGEVQLSGFVNTEQQKRRAEEIASQTPGVFAVHNDLVLKPLVSTPTGRTNTLQENRIYSTPPPSQKDPTPVPTVPARPTEPK